MLGKSDYGRVPPRKKGQKSVYDIVCQVRDTSHKFVEDIENARRWTDSWSNRPLTLSLVNAAMCRCLDSLATTNCVGEANQMPSGELWRIAGHFLETGSLQYQARTKPRGYAGDFEMIAKIVERKSCIHPLGTAFDHFFLSQAAPQAVRHRTDLAAGSIVRCLYEYGQKCGQTGFHVASFGAGPSIDLERFLKLVPLGQRSAIRVTLLDIDPMAIDHSRARLQPYVASGQLVHHRENIFRMPERSRQQFAFPSAHFILCTGLFDYLSDVAAAQMLSCLYRHLAPDGTLMIGNFAPHNPTRTYMEWIGNWYLNYRDATSLLRLADVVGIESSQRQVVADPLGISLFLCVRGSE